MPDPTNPQDLNRYSYVTNNPLTYLDPTGHFKLNWNKVAGAVETVTGLILIGVGNGGPLSYVGAAIAADGVKRMDNKAEINIEVGANMDNNGKINLYSGSGGGDRYNTYSTDVYRIKRLIIGPSEYNNLRTISNSFDYDSPDSYESDFTQKMSRFKSGIRYVEYMSCQIQPIVNKRYQYLNWYLEAGYTGVAPGKLTSGFNAGFRVSPYGLYAFYGFGTGSGAGGSITFNPGLPEPGVSVNGTMRAGVGIGGQMTFGFGDDGLSVSPGIGYGVGSGIALTVDHTIKFYEFGWDK